MARVNEFAYGWLTPTLAYLFSFLGCLLGLKATARARMIDAGRARFRWLLLAAWAIGGTGIWVMHFIAMIGYGVAGAQLRFDLATTIGSWLVAVIVVGVGLFIVGYGRPTALKIIAGGFFTGIGVAAMHYSGMAAMNVAGAKTYDYRLVIASVVIAVVAATVALWFTVTIKRTSAVLGAAAIMAIAVCGMHYTGMSALGVRLNPLGGNVAGWQSLSFLLPIFIFVLLVVIALGYAMLNSLSEADAAALNDLEARLSNAGGPIVAPASSAFRVRIDGR